MREIMMALTCRTFPAAIIVPVDDGLTSFSSAGRGQILLDDIVQLFPESGQKQM